MKKVLLVVVAIMLLVTTSVTFAAGQKETAKPKVTVFWALYDGCVASF